MKRSLCLIIHIPAGNGREISEEIFHRIDCEVLDPGEVGEQDLREGIGGAVEECMIAVKIGSGKRAFSPVLAKESREYLPLLCSDGTVQSAEEGGSRSTQTNWILLPSTLPSAAHRSFSSQSQL